MQGSVWIATRPDLCGEWSQAGGILRLAVAGPWFAVVPRAMWPTDAAQLAMIEKVSARLHPPPPPPGPHFCPPSAAERRRALRGQAPACPTTGGGKFCPE